MVTNKNIKRLFSSVLFLISGGVLLSTMAPTVSLWDCGEFVSCIAKLEVGHPPGAPFYLLLGRFFALFAIDTSQIAYWSNLLSVVASAGTVVLLFSILTHMFGQLFSEELSTPRKYLNILIPAFIGALAFSFTDTFWFSAVESEVYALSIFFTALGVWAVFKWEEEFAKGKNATRWLIFISYLMGLSTGVHLLNLLTIPILFQVVFFRYYEFTWKRFFISLSYGLLILGVVLFGFIENGLWFAKKLELFFVNDLGAPFNTGLIVSVVILFGGLFYGIFKTIKNRPVLHFVLINTLVFFIGYSSYALIIIRADADTPINLNNPSNVFALESFLNREQYGDKPLIYGPSYNSKSTGIEYKESYRPSGDKYESFKKLGSYTYNDKDKTLFPRMFSSQQQHIYGYNQWVDVPLKGSTPPSFLQNLKFLFNYQLGHMYFRYFMWNFSGRQNDEQGNGGPLRGNWITGVKAIDAVRLGNREHLSYGEESSKANNKYFLLPFIFGILGIFFLSQQGKKGNHYLREILLLLLITGPGIVLYLNQTPYEPRKRDYAFIGSFFAYAIFIGFGVYGLIHFLRKRFNDRFGALLATILSFMALPLLLLVNNYDDHNRSGRYLALNMAKSYLNSCDKNSILFTYGDNDTYPLWYAQEVENVRPDLRAVNYGLMGADWCVMQQYNKINDADALALTIDKERYKSGNLDNALLLDKSKEPVELRKVIQFIGNNSQKSKLPLQNGKYIDYSPSNNFIIENGDGTSILWKNPKQVLYKNDIVFMDLLSNGIKKRAVYTTIGSSSDIYQGLEPHLQLIGPVFKLTTETGADSTKGYIDTDVMYNNYMTNIVLGEQGDTYYDHYSKSTFDIARYRMNINRLLLQLLNEKRVDDAKKVIMKSLAEYPIETDPYHSGNVDFIKLMWMAGLKEEAGEKFELLTNIHLHNLTYFMSQSEDFMPLISYDAKEEMKYEVKLKNALTQCNQKHLLEQLKLVQ